MPVREISMHSFRNHDLSKFEFGLGINVLWGGNGSGKTSVLEAIYILAYGRSFRTGKLRETLQIGQKSTNVAGIFEQQGVQYDIRFNQLENGRKKYLLDGSPVRGAPDLIGLNPVVVLSPEEQNITKGPPGNRRAYFDRVFSVVSKKYVTRLVTYTRCLKQRNAALTQVKLNLAPTSIIAAWDDTLCDSGNEIWKLRQTYISEFVDLLQETANNFTLGSIKINLHVNPETPPSTTEHRAKLAQSVKQDLRYGFTRYGPHRDQYEIGFNGQDIRKFGSQGEHKMTLVLIKVVEALFIRKFTGRAPTILLDDLFAKLDFRRSDQVLSALGKDIQTIITGTDIIDLEKRGINLSGPDDTSYHLGAN